jgi:hypothetical protein
MPNPVSLIIGFVLRMDERLSKAGEGQFDWPSWEFDSSVTCFGRFLSRPFQMSTVRILATLTYVQSHNLRRAVKMSYISSVNVAQLSLLCFPLVSIPIQA